MSNATEHQPTKTLNDGHEMPMIGLGVWQSTGGEEIQAVEWALQQGYRHIDTAAIYKNEEGVGQAIAQSGIPREEIFLTTKLWNDDIRAKKARQGLETSLRKLKLDYVDLYLLHWPVQGDIEAWHELQRMQEEGLCRSIGLSNYMPEHLDAILAAADILPAVNQIEYHPYLQQEDVLEACAKTDIAITAWSPLMQGKFLDEPLFHSLAKKYGKTPAQVLLRWDLEHDVITIPKSVKEHRIAENFNILDFHLEQDDIDALDALDRKDGRFGPDPRNFSF